MAAFLSLNGSLVSKAELHIPAIGNWYALVEVSDPSPGTVFSGAVEFVLADLTMRGWIHRGALWHGTYRATLIGGFGGWAKELPPKPYSLSTGVRASLVLNDAARESGERVELAKADDWTLGQAWLRKRAPAGRVLTQFGRPWYVRAVDGVTVIAPRATGAIGAAFDVIGANPEIGCYTIATDAPAAFVPGKTLTGVNLPAPVTIRSVTHRASGKEFRTEVWS